VPDIPGAHARRPARSIGPDAAGERLEHGRSWRITPGRPCWCRPLDSDEGETSARSATDPRSHARRSTTIDTPSSAAEAGGTARTTPLRRYDRPPFRGGGGHQECRSLVSSGPLKEISGRQSERYTGRGSFPAATRSLPTIRENERIEPLSPLAGDDVPGQAIHGGTLRPADGCHRQVVARSS